MNLQSGRLVAGYITPLAACQHSVNQIQHGTRCGQLVLCPGTTESLSGGLLPPATRMPSEQLEKWAFPHGSWVKLVIVKNVIFNPKAVSSLKSSRLSEGTGLLKFSSRGCCCLSGPGAHHIFFICNCLVRCSADPSSDEARRFLTPPLGEQSFTVSQRSQECEQEKVKTLKFVTITTSQGLINKQKSEDLLANLKLLSS